MGLLVKEENRENRLQLFLCLLDTFPYVNTVLKQLNCAKDVIMSLTRNIYGTTYRAIQILMINIEQME